MADYVLGQALEDVLADTPKYVYQVDFLLTKETYWCGDTSELEEQFGDLSHCVVTKWRLTNPIILPAKEEVQQTADG